VTGVGKVIPGVFVTGLNMSRRQVMVPYTIIWRCCCAQQSKLRIKEKGVENRPSFQKSCDLLCNWQLASRIASCKCNVYFVTVPITALLVTLTVRQYGSDTVTQ